MSDQQPDLGSMISGLFGGEGGFDLSKITAMFAPIMALVQQSGGLQGLLEKLQSSGLGDQVNSWISTGQNALADPSQITEALGVENVKSVADQAGMSVEALSEQVTTALPNLVDKLSPNGQMPSMDQMQGMIQNLPGAEQLSGILHGLLGKQS